MLDPQFYLKNGDLSRYSLHCGYIQQKTRADGVRVDLALDSAVYTIKTYKDNARMRWDCYDSLTEARREFKKALSEEIV